MGTLHWIEGEVQERGAVEGCLTVASTAVGGSEGGWGLGAVTH